jgi:ubiquinone/menaquinone biosynthesis C-methylase UbiE
MKVPDYDFIFNHQASKYDRLVMAEDYQGNLIRTMNDLGLLSKEAVVADLGSGTGRVAFMIASHVFHVYGVEPVAAMRQFAQAKTASTSITNTDFLPGEHKDLPLADGSVDLITEGWAFLRAFRTSLSNWRSEFAAIRREMLRILRPAGSVFLIETMGSFDLWKEAPDSIKPLYTYFSEEWGLMSRVIQTDYQFQDLSEAVDLGSFFFGDEIGKAIQAKGDPVVPEATIVWYGRLN